MQAVNVNTEASDDVDQYINILYIHFMYINILRMPTPSCYCQNFKLILHMLQKIFIEQLCECYMHFY